MKLVDVPDQTGKVFVITGYKGLVNFTFFFFNKILKVNYAITFLFYYHSLHIIHNI